MSTDPDERPVAEETVRRFLADDATARALGITVSDVAPGSVRAHMTISAAMLNGHGTAHGAALFALGDIAFAMACNSHGAPAVGRSSQHRVPLPRISRRRDHRVGGRALRRRPHRHLRHRHHP